MATQSSIAVDAGTGSAVDFTTLTGGNKRQVIVIGDPTTDANYVNVSNGSMQVAVSNQIVFGSGSNVIGTVTVQGGASGETGTIFNGSLAISPSFGTITFSNLGNNVVLGTITAKRIRVIAMSFLIGTATNLYITDSAGSTLWGNGANTGQFAANSGIVLPYCPVGYFQTGSGNALVMNLSATSSVAGAFTYLTI